MDFALDPDIEDYRQELRRFATKNLAPYYQSDDKAGRMRPDLVPSLAGMGLTGLRIPDEFGGQGASALLAGIAAEEVARADFNASYIIIVTALISDVLVRNGTPQQQARWLPGIADGTSIPCIAITEPGHGTDAATLELKAVEDGDGWLLHGEKTSITLGLYANACLVLARTGGPGARGVSAFYVNLDDERVTRTGFEDFGGRSTGRSSLHFDGVRVTRDELVGEIGDGFVSVMQGFDYCGAIFAPAASAPPRRPWDRES